MNSHFSALIKGVKNSDGIIENIRKFNKQFENLDPSKTSVPYLDFKEDEHHIIVYSENNDLTGNPIDDDTKSIIIDKSKLKPIVSQFNKMIYNDDAINFLKDKTWGDNITVKYCYEGTMIVVFYSHNKWYVCTRKCLDAKNSFWIRNISYYDLFMEAIEGKFKIEDLNKNNCYHFILIHHKNKNIVDYSYLGGQYKNVALAMTTEKFTLKRIKFHINDKILYPKVLVFANLDEVLAELKNISDGDKYTHHISTEGIVVDYVNNNTLTILKLQTNVYKFINEHKPNISNVDAMLLGLYQTNRLCDIAPFFASDAGDVINRIHAAMQTISYEILNMYHLTRSRKNKRLYEQLPGSYRRALFQIHGKFLQKRQRETKQHRDNYLGDHKSITVHDVYDCLKNELDLYTLKKIFIDRLDLIDNPEINELIVVDSFDALLQGKLMT